VGSGHPRTERLAAAATIERSDSRKVATDFTSWTPSELADFAVIHARTGVIK